MGFANVELRGPQTSFIRAAAAALSSTVGVRNLEQPLPAEVRGKHERILVLHHKFQNVSQSFGFVSVIEADASAVKRVR